MLRERPFREWPASFNRGRVTGFSQRTTIVVEMLDFDNILSVVFGGRIAAEERHEPVAGKRSGTATRVRSCLVGGLAVVTESCNG